MSESPFVKKTTASARPLFGGRRPLLGRLDVELTERCDNDCVHCNINKPLKDNAARARELSTADVNRILSEAAALGTLAVRFTGGEPLVREDFDEIYVFARRLGLRVHLFTNARGITPERATLLARIPPLEKVEVTVYGMRKESYEAVSRIRGSWEEFRRGVDLLLEHKIPFIVKGTLLPATRGERSEFEAWARTLPWMERPPSFVEALDMRARRDDDRKNGLIETLRSSAAPSLPVAGAAERGQTVDFCSRFLGPPGDALFDCGAGGKCTVDSYGGLQPCLQLRHPDTVYDLRSGSVKDAVESFFPLLRGRRATDPAYLERCARCFLRGLCEQCPAKSWMEHGTLDTPVEYLCERAHGEARALGLLGPDERSWDVADWAERLSRLQANDQPTRSNGDSVRRDVPAGATAPFSHERRFDSGE